ncbi:MAG: dual specificity protein phosphatase family protein, partial [Thaumarchaeota archaeon]|nr:dual specificity protein phosphatase family protein [Nitrososphaerota archaeon]
MRLRGLAVGCLGFEEIRRLLSGRPANFSFVDESASGSALPVSKREVIWIKRNGISAILSLTETPLNSDWVVGFEYMNIPMKDHAIPTLDQLTRAVRFLLLQTQKNNRVLVHCLAGKGRTGTVLAAYLCQRYDLSPDESIARLRSNRP